MNWRNLSATVRHLLCYPACILLFINCASATIGLLYLQSPFDVGFQYLPAVAAAAFFLSRLLYAFEHGIKVSGNERWAYLFALSTALAVGMQISLGIDSIDRDGISSLDYTVAMWVFNMFYFFAGAATSRISYQKSDVVAVILLLLVVIPFIYAPKQGIFINYWQLRQLTGGTVNHLLISEWCVFLFIGAFAFASDKLRPVVIVASVICLFGLQGRSSTFFAPFSMLVLWILISGKRTVFIYACVAAIALVTLSLLPTSTFLLSDNELALERMLLDAEDNSLLGRQNILMESLQHLPKSMLYGDPTYIAYEAGRMGSYIHNILSMWQFFGLLPFILILLLLVRSLLLMRERIIAGQLSVMEEIGSMVLIYATVSVVISKSVVFYWLWFAVGFWMLQYAGQRATEMYTVGLRPVKKKRRSRSRKTSQSPVSPGRKYRF